MHLTLYVPLALLAMCGTAEVRAQTAMRIHGIVLENPQRPRYVSGVVASYATFTVAPGQGNLTTIFVPYFKTSQFLPGRGDKCQIEYILDRVEGLLRSVSIYASNVPVATRISCGSRSWATS
jgi:hypothetical protein